MAKIEDSAFDNFNNDGTQSDNESSDDLSPIDMKSYGKKRRHRKRSTSLPFIETNNGGLWKGLVAAKEMQSGKSTERHHTRGARKGIEWKSDLPEDETTEIMKQKSHGGDRPTRRSSSMPEFYSRSGSKKDEFSRHRKTKGSGLKTRNKTDGAATRDLEMREDEKTLKLPVISSDESFKCGKDQNGNETESLTQSAESMKIQRKTYLPHINSNNGNVFMKSR